MAAEPTLGRAGYWLMTVTALFATAGATNAGLYPATGLSERLAETGQFPPLMARKLGGRASAGLLIQAAACLVLALVFKLDAIGSCRLAGLIRTWRACDRDSGGLTGRSTARWSPRAQRAPIIN